MTNEEMLSVAEIVERLVARFHKQADDHEAKMVEHRAAFGARTEADEKIIAGLRAERDGLLTQVQDMVMHAAWRAARMRSDAKTALRLSTEAAKLAQSKKGAWVKTTDGRVLSVRGYMVRLSPDREEFYDGSTCTPCDPPAADHDTPEGKLAAESVIRNDRKTEPDEIKVGDVVEVFQSTASCTFKTDIGTRGTVLQLDDSCVDTAPLDGFLAPKYNHVALCDVRKVTT